MAKEDKSGAATCLACGAKKPKKYIQFVDSKGGAQNKLSELLERCTSINFACTGGALCRNCHRSLATLDVRTQELKENCMMHGYHRIGGSILSSVILPKEVHDHWRRIGTTQNLSTDADIAIFLLQHYETPTSGVHCSTCSTPVKLTRVVCYTCKQKTVSQEIEPEVNSTSKVTRIYDKRSEKTTQPLWDDSFGEVPVTTTCTTIRPKKSTVNKNDMPVPTTSALSVISSQLQVEADRISPCTHASTSTVNPLLHAATGIVNSTGGCTHKGVKVELHKDDAQTSRDLKLNVQSDQQLVAEPLIHIDHDEPQQAYDDDENDIEEIMKVSERTMQRSVETGHLADHDYIVPPISVKLTPDMFKLDGQEVTLPDAELLSHAKGETNGRPRQFILPKGPIKLTVNMPKQPFLFLPCKVCGCCFNNAAALRTHVASHKLGGRFKCNICDLAFCSAEDEEQHAEIHKESFKCKKYICHECGRTIKHASAFIGHVKSHAKKVPGHFPCPQCERVFTHRFRLNEHFRLHTRVKPYKCKLCDKQFRWHCNLRDHCRSQHNTGGNKFVCETCGKSCTQNWLLQKHMRMHRQEPSSVCDHCGKGFYCLQSLRLHLELQHNDKSFLTGEPVVCEFCGSEFSSKTVLSYHQNLKKHSGQSACLVRKRGMGSMGNRAEEVECIKSASVVLGVTRKKTLPLQDWELTLKCKDCGERFSHLKTLRRHCNRIHSDNKSHKCISCSKSFFYKRDLDLHSEKHITESEKHHVCECCGRVFLTETHKERHMKYVHGEYAQIRKERARLAVKKKVYQCKLCDKSLTAASTLKRHMLIHSGERPYKCTLKLCPATFRDKQSWTQHMRIGHEPDCKPYVCVLCKASYRSRDGLRQHKKKLGHGVNPLVHSTTSTVNSNHLVHAASGTVNGTSSCMHHEVNTKTVPISITVPEAAAESVPETVSEVVPSSVSLAVTVPVTVTPPMDIPLIATPSVAVLTTASSSDSASTNVTKVVPKTAAALVSRSVASVTISDPPPPQDIDANDAALGLWAIIEHYKYL